jgi:hypothetical protein
MIQTSICVQAAQGIKSCSEVVAKNMPLSHDDDRLYAAYDSGLYFGACVRLQISRGGQNKAIQNKN